MPILDIMWRLLRRSIGKGPHNLLRSRIGRHRQFHSLQHYESIFAFYKKYGMNPDGRNIAEIGSGMQYYTALFFRYHGAREVSLVDPEWCKIPESLLSDQTRIFESTYGKLPPGGEFRIYRDISEAEPDLRNKIDHLCSNTVMEHLKDLDSFFQFTKSLLKDDGTSINFIDLTDHAYHVFINRGRLDALFSRNRLRHLRYSEKLYKLLSDNKCYMNRCTVPEYVTRIGSHGLKIVRMDIRKDEQDVRVHSDVLSRCNSRPGDEKLRALNISLVFKKSSPIS